MESDSRENQMNPPSLEQEINKAGNKHIRKLSASKVINRKDLHLISFEAGAKWAMEKMKNHEIDHCAICGIFGEMFSPARFPEAEKEYCHVCSEKKES